ncbi:MAG: ATP-dependent DNA ligase [Candidatus Micrarchaeota archaeon]
MKFAYLAEVFDKIESTSSRLEMTDILAAMFKKADSDNAAEIIYLMQGKVVPAYEGIEIGMGEKFVEQAIAKSTGYAIKEIEKNYHKTGDLGLTAQEMASKKKQHSLASSELTVKHVFDSFKKIALLSGTGSQDMKIKTLVELLNNAGPVEAKFIARIPVDKMRLGVGDPTVLDALSVYSVGDKSLRERLQRGYDVSSDLGLVAKTLLSNGIEAVDHIEMKVDQPLQPALCERLPSAEEIIKKLGMCACELKYDGIRLQLHKKGDNVKIFSRHQENMTHMFPDVVKAVRENIKLKNAILDAEALSFNELTGEFLPFQQTVQRRRKYDIVAKAKEFPIKLFLFDILYDGKNTTALPYEERRKKLEKSVKDNEMIKLSDRIITDSPEELTKYFDDAVARGLEGIIAKDLKAPYTVGARKFAWIKLKRSYRGELSDTIDVAIVGFYKGKGMRTKFGFGGFLGAVYDQKEDMFRTIARVGSGFSEEQMAEMNESLSKIKISKKSPRVDSVVDADYWVTPKFVAEVLADEITESPMHTAGRKGEIGYALRFPRMVKLRPDRKPEDATSVSEIIRMFSLQKREKIEGTA